MASLLDKSKQITVQDDLESFFHVLLFYAVRYLPSNCSDVGSFILRFFEEADLVNGEYKCGHAKLAAIRNGDIRLAETEEALYFKANDTNGIEPHPLDKVFTELLQWFTAYYRVTIFKPKPKEKTSASFDDADDEVFDDYGLPQEPPEISPQEDGVQFAMDTKAAANLTDHTKMISYMMREINKPSAWPKTDKVEDRLPVNYKFYKTGSKRTAELCDEDDIFAAMLPPSKRQKSSPIPPPQDRLGISQPLPIASAPPVSSYIRHHRTYKAKRRI